MAKDTRKEFRLILDDADDVEVFDLEFRILCALNDQTVDERMAQLMRENVRADWQFPDGTWINQQGLLDALKEAGHEVSRQTLRNHRKGGILPSDYFVESKIDPNLPQAAKNQRSYYRLKECLEFYSKENDPE